MVTNRQFNKINNHYAGQRRYQRGMSMWGWLIIAMMAGTIGLAGIKLFPIYNDYFSLLSIAKDIQREPGLASAGKTELQKSVAKRMRNNGIWDLDHTVLQIKKNPNGGGLIVTIDYEQRIHLFGNLDMVATFKQEIQ